MKKPRKTLHGTVRLNVVLPDGTSRPATKDDEIALSATWHLSLADIHLSKLPSHKQLDKEQAALDRQWHVLMDGLQAVTKPDKLLVEQIAVKLGEIDDARRRLSDQQFERFDMERTRKLLEIVRREAIERIGNQSL